MNAILIGDFLEEKFILASPPGRFRWPQETASLSRMGGVILTKRLLQAYNPEATVNDLILPEKPENFASYTEVRGEDNNTFYSQLFELDPVSRLTVRVLQRSRRKKNPEWTIKGQIKSLSHQLKNKNSEEDFILYVEQEDYKSKSRSEEIQCVFDFIKNYSIKKLFIKTNKPSDVLNYAIETKPTIPTIILSSLRALNEELLNTHTWDATVRHVLDQIKIKELPESIKVGIELWNEGFLWVGVDNCMLIWDMERPLGSQRLRGKGWTPGLMNVTCACLLSHWGKNDQLENQHIEESWVLSRQCALLGKANEKDDILDLTDQLEKLIKIEDKHARPRSTAFGIAEFKPNTDSTWSFLRGLDVKDHLVQEIVQVGPRALCRKNCIYLRVGRLFEIQETIIESLLSLNHLLRDYAARKLAARPLSIAVFGSAGSGKSFTVTELVRSAGLALDPVFFSYNLSQLRSVDDIEPAFHAVQSSVLRGNLPVVFWDEFDATLDGRPLGWIKYFLGPMQDGEFFVRGTSHPLGRSIFVFAGATAENYIEFMERRKDETSINAKLPDFLSRIKAWIDIPALPASGTNEGRLQRAILIHALLRRHAPHVNEIDENVIKYLISEKFKTARDLERVIEAAALSDTNKFTKSRLLFQDRNTRS